MNHYSLISVVMPVYNAEQYLDESIQSILDQTFGNFEFIIIDDGSTDQSLSIIKRYASKDARIIIVSRENKGIVDTLNEGIAMARGKYIARMDADDISLPNRFELQVAFLEKYHNIGIVGSYASIIASSSVWKVPIDDTSIRANLLFATSFLHPTVMFRHAAIKEMDSLYDSNYKGMEDFELWGRILEKTEGYNIPKALLRYRIVQDSLTRQLEKKTKLYTDMKSKIILKNPLGVEIERQYIEAYITSNAIEKKVLYFDFLLSRKSRYDSRKIYRKIKWIVGQQWLTMTRSKKNKHLIGLKRINYIFYGVMYYIERYFTEWRYFWIR